MSGSHRRRSSVLSLAVVLVLSGVLVACSPALTPSVFSPHYGAPRRSAPGEVQIGLAVNPQSIANAPWLNVHVVDGLKVEAGVETTASLRNQPAWTMGRLGARYTFQWRENLARGEMGKGFALDLEGGGGLGFFRREYESDDCDAIGHWLADLDMTSLAGGLYVGAGAAYHFGRWFALFARARQQFTKTGHTPWTFWFTTLAGPEFSIGPLHIYAAAGHSHLWNQDTSDVGFFGEVGFALRFRLAWAE